MCQFNECVPLFRFFATNAGLVYLYFSGFQKVDEEEFGGAWELTKEGFMTSFAGFLVSLSYNQIVKCRNSRRFQGNLQFCIILFNIVGDMDHSLFGDAFH
jgi:hypothetical protein